MSYLIKQATIVNEGEIKVADIWIEDNKIVAIGTLSQESLPQGTSIIEAEGKYLFPGVIDIHVHFREPGLTQKGDIASESRAGVAGGVTSYLEMPNTNPPTVSLSSLKAKLDLAAEHSMSNYGFFVGATQKNIDEVLQMSTQDTCAIKVYLGSSTGNMLLDNVFFLEKLFAEATLPIVAHCEDETLIREQTAHYKQLLGLEALPSIHPLVRSAEACYKSSAFAIDLAQRYQTRLHIAHLTTERELSLLSDEKYTRKKRITAEVSPTHLWFNENDFRTKGNLIKCNPAIKTEQDRQALIGALSSHKIDLVATDHAPHTWEEKQQPYFEAPSGLPSIQHSLISMLELYHRGNISLETIVETMSHNPARLVGIQNRGFIREGYFADFVLVDLHSQYEVSKKNLYYKCGWSPLEGEIFSSKVLTTWVNGEIVFNRGDFLAQSAAKQLTFDR